MKSFLKVPVLYEPKSALGCKGHTSGTTLRRALGFLIIRAWPRRTRLTLRTSWSKDEDDVVVLSPSESFSVSGSTSTIVTPPRTPLDAVERVCTRDAPASSGVECRDPVLGVGIRGSVLKKGIGSAGALESIDDTVVALG